MATHVRYALALGALSATSCSSQRREAGERRASSRVSNSKSEEASAAVAARRKRSALDARATASLVRSSAPRTLLVATRGGASSPYWRVTSA